MVLLPVLVVVGGYNENFQQTWDLESTPYPLHAPISRFIKKNGLIKKLKNLRFLRSLLTRAFLLHVQAIASAVPTVSCALALHD